MLVSPHSSRTTDLRVSHLPNPTLIPDYVLVLFRCFSSHEAQFTFLCIFTFTWAKKFNQQFATRVSIVLLKWRLSAVWWHSICDSLKLETDKSLKCYRSICKDLKLFKYGRCLFVFLTWLHHTCISMLCDAVTYMEKSLRKEKWSVEL